MQIVHTHSHVLDRAFMVKAVVLLAVLALCALGLARYHGYGIPGWGGPATGPMSARISTAPIVAPVSDPAALRPVTEGEAQRINAGIPVSAEPNPAAKPLVLSLSDGQNWLRAIDCMTAAIYYEAAQEPLDGQRAVAQVIANRVRDPQFPNTVCGVIFEGSQLKTGCQFSFTCDGSLARIPSRSGWARARNVALEALSGAVFAPVGMATHYHANYVAPYWAPVLTKVKVLGAHIFYRWPGRRGGPGAFTARYAAAEPAVAGEAALSAALLSGAMEQALTPADAPITVAERGILAIDGARLQPGAALPAGPATRPLAQMQPRPAPLAKAAGQRWILLQNNASAAPPAPQAGDAVSGSREPPVATHPTLPPAPAGGEQ